MAESENRTDKKVSTGLAPLPSGTFEHDVAVSDKYQRFSTELLRLSLAGIGGIGFLLVNYLFSPQSRDQFKWLVKNTTFGFWLVLSLLFFAVSAGLALFHFYFGADSKSYHLKYLRLEQRLGDSTQIETIGKREDFNTCWNLYYNGKKYDENDADKLIKIAADERDVRNFLLKISGKMLFYAGLFLWLGAITLAFSFLSVIFN